MRQIALALALTLSAGFSTIYGLNHRQKGIYVQLIVAGCGVMMLGGIYRLVASFTGINYVRTFNVGLLSVMGAYMFFFTANYGKMDSLLDLDKGVNTTYNMVAGVFSGIMILMYLAILGSPTTTQYKVTALIIVLLIALSSFYSIKHLMVPDIEGGIVGTLKPFNAVLAASGVAYIVFLIGEAWQNAIIMWIGMGALSVTMVLMTPVLMSCVRKWIV